MRWRRLWLGALALVACATATSPVLRWSAPARGPKTSDARGSAGAAYDRDIGGRFAAERTHAGDLTYAQLVARWDLARAPDCGPSFDPTGARYWKKVRDALSLTAEEQAIFRRTGVVGVDFAQRTTMASAYLAVYRRDLPVLITTDSILHALHRSFDNMLIELESDRFGPEFRRILGLAHDQLRRQASTLSSPALRRSAEDVDLYLTVAQNLLVAPSSEQRRAELRCTLDPGAAHCDEDVAAGGAERPLQVRSLFEQDDTVRAVLDAIRALVSAQVPALYGRRDVTVDWSQFTPRGHYTKSPVLRGYFRALMWLGRVDLGFALVPPDGAFGTYDVPRERRDALLLADLLQEAHVSEALAAIDGAISFLVGVSDDVRPSDLTAGMKDAGIARVAELDDAAKVEAAVAAAARVVSGQRIRSQIGWRPPGAGTELSLPLVFQLFGQRFVIDSFVLSKVVFDSIKYGGVLQERPMPAGLDVMAALGNDEAVALLEPELTRWNYGANLLAARRVVEERPPEAWNATLYDTWLSALAKLDDTPAGEFPDVMRGRAWQRKQLETQLASWAELRHDTILYVKQSHTMGILCEYPEGYVEPYPELFGRLAFFAEEAAGRLSAGGLASPGAAAFLTAFSQIVRHLEALARSELAGRPFTKQDEQFVKDAIQVKTERRGCGPPTVIYTGWYRKLLYQSSPAEWVPTIADVHTDPNSGTVLEEGTGDVDFVVVAVNNRDDRAVYVGPVYSYYEFPSDHRMTDEEWRKRLAAGQAGGHPAWSGAWRGSPAARKL